MGSDPQEEARTKYCIHQISLDEKLEGEAINKQAQEYVKFSVDQIMSFVGEQGRGTSVIGAYTKFIGTTRVMRRKGKETRDALKERLKECLV